VPVALQEALRGFFQRIDRARQRALASRGSEEEGYEEPARLKFSGAAAFYVGSTGEGFVSSSSQETSPPLERSSLGWCSGWRTFSQGLTCPE
jgi:hypothetical protein